MAPKKEVGIKEFDQFAQDYKTVLDKSIKLSGYDSDYFIKYKAGYISRLLGNDFTGRVLDYGCGVGLLSEIMLKHFPNSKVNGYDVSAVSIEEVPLHLKRQGTFTSDLNDLQDKYDLIVVANVYHHIIPPQRLHVTAALKELMAPTGKIIIFEHNPFNPLTRKIVKDSPLDKDAILLKPTETLSYMLKQGLRQHLDYIVFFPKVLSIFHGFEPFLRWCPLGAQYVVVGELWA